MVKTEARISSLEKRLSELENGEKARAKEMLKELDQEYGLKEIEHFGEIYNKIQAIEKHQKRLCKWILMNSCTLRRL